MYIIESWYEVVEPGTKPLTYMVNIQFFQHYDVALILSLVYICEARHFTNISGIQFIVGHERRRLKGFYEATIIRSGLPFSFWSRVISRHSYLQLNQNLNTGL